VEGGDAVRISVVSATRGQHTHLEISVNGGVVAEDLTLRNEDVAEFLARLRPEDFEDRTREPHVPVAARALGTFWAGRVQ
jgi:hypothetical protein